MMGGKTLYVTLPLGPGLGSVRLVGRIAMWGKNSDGSYEAELEPLSQGGAPAARAGKAKRGERRL